LPVAVRAEGFDRNARHQGKDFENLLKLHGTGVPALHRYLSFTAQDWHYLAHFVSKRISEENDFINFLCKQTEGIF
jgi:hypothetical protein